MYRDGVQVAYRPLEMALTLIRSALPLLDAADEDASAALLRDAIAAADPDGIETDCQAAL